MHKKIHNMKRSSLSLCSVAIALFSNSTMAATATANIPITLAVTAPTCTVSNEAASVVLPTATNPNITLANYLTANGITTAGVEGSGWKTASALNQTAKITCTAANTTITSFVVQPAASATLYPGSASELQLVDTSVPPQKAFNGTGQIAFEQVSVNGNASSYSYNNTTTKTIRPYSTPFVTGALNGGSSIATVIWRPVFGAGAGENTSIGLPMGGSFSSAAQIVVNY